MVRGSNLIVVFTLLLGTACGDSTRASGGSGGGGGGVGGTDAGPSGSTCGEVGRSGETPCEASVAGSCPAGQYCDTVRLTCTPGCTGDANCGAEDRCVRASGEAIGACAACPSCGDGTCEGGESRESCPTDCGGGPGGTCGDGTCGADETAESCPSDCGGSATSLEQCIRGCARAGECGAPTGEVEACRASCGAATPSEQRAVGECDVSDCAVVASCFGLECLTSAQCSGASTCIDGSCCGNGTCGEWETYEACPADCGDDLLLDCLDECDTYDFFECGAIGCASACTASTPPDRLSFIECANPTACNYDTCSHLL